MHTLFITATGTNVGKTHTTIELIKAFASHGISVGVCKPIETGVTDIPMDAKLLLETCREVNPSFASLVPHDITAYTFALPAAPFCADIEQTIEPQRIYDKIAELGSLCDLLIIEGAGGLMVPITSEYMMIDLIKHLNTPTLLVTPSRLGSINDTLLSMESLQSRAISFEWCVNLHEDAESFAEVTQPYYDEAFPQWWSVGDGLDGFVARFLRDITE